MVVIHIELKIIMNLILMKNNNDSNYIFFPLLKKIAIKIKSENLFKTMGLTQHICVTYTYMQPYNDIFI